MRYVKQIVTERSPRASVLRWLASTVMISVAALCLSLPALAQTKYVITDGDHVIVCMSSSTDPEVVIEEAGLQLGEADTFTTMTDGEVSEIHINRIQMITVHNGSETLVVGSYGGTAADVLASLDITLSEDDTLSCEPDAKTYDGMTISLSHRTQRTENYEKVLPFETKYYEDVSMRPDEELVLVEGSDGLAKCEALVTYEDGVAIQQTILRQQILQQPVTRIVLRGVDRSVKTQENSGNDDYLQSATSLKDHDLDASIDGVSYVPGTNIPYAQRLEFQATAYYSPTSWNTTFTGTEAQVGTIAVDPSVIPLGTKMYVVSADGQYVYGYGIAEDTGGAIKGNIVDLYFNTYDECIQFGRRDVYIYILG